MTPYYALFSDKEGELGLLEETFFSDADRKMPIEYVRELLSDLGCAFEAWVVDFQDVAVQILRRSGDYPGIGGRLKKTGELLCSFCGDQKEDSTKDYLRIGLNGTVINADVWPEASMLIATEICKLVGKYPTVAQALEY